MYFFVLFDKFYIDNVEIIDLLLLILLLKLKFFVKCCSVYFIDNYFKIIVFFINILEFVSDCDLIIDYLFDIWDLVD